jgi:hypothetical protein
MTKVSKKADPEFDVLSAAPEIVTVRLGKARSETPEVKVDGVNEIAALDALIAMLLAVRDEYIAKFKQQAAERFLREGLARKRRPQNYKAVDSGASASVQLRAKRQALTEDAVALCVEHGIDIEEEVKIVASFIIAPEYASDGVFISEFERRCGSQLRAMEDRRGPIIRKQPGWSAHKISECGQDAIFDRPEEVARLLFPIAFSLAVKATLEVDDNLRPAIQIIERLLAGVTGADSGASTTA